MILAWLIAFFTSDVLHQLTFVMLIVASTLNFFPNRKLRIFFSLSYLLSFFYWHKTLLDTENAYNFLFSLVLIKTLESETKRDKRVIFMGQILLIVSATLFNKHLTYFIFSIFALVYVFFNLSKSLNEPFLVNWKRLPGVILKMLPILFVIFFLLPRFSSGLGFIPTPIPQTKGQIGFNADLNFSDIAKLESNNEEVFIAKMDKMSQPIYWRGQVMSNIMGFSWNRTHEEREKINLIKNFNETSEKEILQEIWFKKKANRIFIMDYPQILLSHLGGSLLDQNENYLLQSQQSVSRVVVYSTVKPNLRNPNEYHKKVPILTSQVQKLIDSFPNQPEHLIEKLKNYFQSQSFYYSLSPGQIRNLGEFLFTHKKGFCGHYSSAVGIILRAKGIPARLVGGYLGGNWNEDGAFYTITENDAHVWVEYWHQGQWKRIDPTIWVFPERPFLVGEEILEGNSKRKKNDLFLALNQINAQIDLLNFKFMVWSESYNEQSQSYFLQKFKIRREFLYLLLLWTIAGCVGVMYLWEIFRKGQENRENSPHIYYFEKLIKKLRKKGLNDDYSFQSIEIFLEKLNEPKLNEKYYIFKDVFYIDLKPSPEKLKKLKRSFWWV